MIPASAERSQQAARLRDMARSTAIRRMTPERVAACEVGAAALLREQELAEQVLTTIHETPQLRDEFHHYYRDGASMMRDLIARRVRALFTQPPPPETP